MQKKNSFAVLDIAYQGIKCNILDDLNFTPLYMIQKLLVAQFFDKNFSIYAEGASVVHAVDHEL